jgi:hypothetical protein
MRMSHHAGQHLSSAIPDHMRLKSIVGQIVALVSIDISQEAPRLLSATVHDFGSAEAGTIGLVRPRTAPI